MDHATPTRGRIEELLAPLRADPGAAAILSDIDGTLAPIVRLPEDASVPDEARRLLAALADRYALVACVSGRRATDARRVTGLDHIAYAGNHGFELLLPGEAESRPHPSLDGHEADAARFLEHLDRGELDRAGLRVEDKGAIVAPHWRAAGDEAEAEALAVRIAAAARSAGLRSHRGRKVLEIRPDVEIGKADAVHALLADRDLTAALYAGDDRTDLDAFRTLRERRDAGRLEAVVCVGIASEEGAPEVHERSDLVVDGLPGFVEILRLLAA